MVYLEAFPVVGEEAPEGVLIDIENIIVTNS